MKKLLLLFLLAAIGTGIQAQTEKTQKAARTYRYRVQLVDKKDNGHSLKQPEKFLSEKSLARRKKFGLALDEHDLPVTQKYLDKLEETGARVVCTSKWNNTAVVEVDKVQKANSLRQLPFVKSATLVWEGSCDNKKPQTPEERERSVTNKLDSIGEYYGRGKRQVEMLNAHKLHQLGYKGEGMTIAIIDGGFQNADCIAALKDCKILGTRNFVRPGYDVYAEQNHGMMVLSCMAANRPNSLVGTAPEASYYLLVSEDGRSEQLVEEDYWCAAIEYADSLGADIVTSSLGYYHFDNKRTDHTYRDLDGLTAINSRSASLAASRGILVFTSAGNSGNDRWKKITPPGDASDVLTVGAVNLSKENAEFSSVGNTADNRIKPDVMAVGERSALLMSDGSVGRANGTSFSTPILCGAVACLWQAFPQKKPTEIIRAVQQSGSNAAYPDNVFGYGIPDLWKAYQQLKK